MPNPSLIAMEDEHKLDEREHKKRRAIESIRELCVVSLQNPNPDADSLFVIIEAIIEAARKP